MKKNHISIYISSAEERTNNQVTLSRYYLIFHLLFFFLTTIKAKKQLLAKDEQQDHIIFCISKVLSEKKYFSTQDSIPWGVFVALSTSQRIKKNDSWGIIWPCKIGVNVSGSTLQTLPASELLSEQKRILEKVLTLNKSEAFFIDGANYFLIKFNNKKINFLTFLPELTHYYIKPELSEGTGKKYWLKLLTEIEMEWSQEGCSGSVNSLWAGSIGNMAVNLTKDNNNSRENNPEVLSRTVLKGLNVYLMHKYKEQINVDLFREGDSDNVYNLSKKLHFLRTSYKRLKTNIFNFIIRKEDIFYFRSIETEEKELVKRDNLKSFKQFGAFFDPFS